jgi:hypothetical protein
MSVKIGRISFIMRGRSVEAAISRRSDGQCSQTGWVEPFGLAGQIG